MYRIEAQSKEWPKTVLFDSNCKSREGTLVFRYTDTAAVFILLNDDQDRSFLDNPDLYASDVLECPIREINGQIVIDLLYYCEYSFIDDPPRICFHDPVQEFGISLTFDSPETGHDIRQFISKFLTTETPSLPGFFKITRFLPPFAPSTKSLRKVSSPNQLPPISDEDFQNVITIFQQSIMPQAQNKKEYRPVYEDDFDPSNFEQVTKILQNHNIVNSELFLTWLTLLHLPQPDKFEDLFVQKYIKAKSQWNTFTRSQLLRSSLYCNFINHLTSYVKTTKFEANFPQDSIRLMQMTTFNVFMTLGEIERSFHSHIPPLLDLMYVILRISNSRVENSFVNICNKYTVTKGTYEAIIFWVMLKILLRGELLRLLPLSMKNTSVIVEPITQFLQKVSPYIHEAITARKSGLIEISPFICSLFVSFFKYEDLVNVWSAAMYSRSINEFFMCFITVCLAFSERNLREISDAVDSPSTVVLIQQALSRRGIDFIVAATLNLMEKSHEMIGSFNQDLENNSDSSL